MGYDDIKALRYRISNETIVTLIYRREDLACTRFINLYRWRGINSLFYEVSEALGASWVGTPARLGRSDGGRHTAVVNTKECLYKVAAARSVVSKSRNISINKV